MPLVRPVRHATSRLATSPRPLLLALALGLTAASACAEEARSGETTAKPEPSGAASAATSPSTTDPAPTKDNGKAVQIANPASTNCVEKGGKLEIVTDASGGQYGVCGFDDGSYCEEWAFMRGECSKGQCKDPKGDCK
jgi:putative hemolysin